MDPQKVMTFRVALQENPVFIDLMAYLEEKVKKEQANYFKQSRNDEGRDDCFLRIKHWQELIGKIKSKLANTGKDK